MLDKDKAPYRANQQLMIPLGSFLRRELVLAASHASAQWFLLEKFAGLMDLQVPVCENLGRSATNVTFFFM